MNPVKVIAEIGVNHQGSLDMAKRLVDAAQDAGCDYVKFQKRDPAQSVHPTKHYEMRATPFGTMTRIDYRRKMEFSEADIEELARYCDGLGQKWFFSVWDAPSLLIALHYQPEPIVKLPSARLTDLGLIQAAAERCDLLILSTGMSTMAEVEDGVAAAIQPKGHHPVIMHCHSQYPIECPEETNLRVIRTFRAAFPRSQIGWSGHERDGFLTSLTAAGLDADWIERHITLDRTLPGSDHAASLEPKAIKQLVDYLRLQRRIMGTGNKVFWESEMPAKRKLREGSV